MSLSVTGEALAKYCCAFANPCNCVVWLAGDHLSTNNHAPSICFEKKSHQVPVSACVYFGKRACQTALQILTTVSSHKVRRCLKLHTLICEEVIRLKFNHRQGQGWVQEAKNIIGLVFSIWICHQIGLQVIAKELILICPRQRVLLAFSFPQ